MAQNVAEQVKRTVCRHPTSTKETRVSARKGSGTCVAE